MISPAFAKDVAAVTLAAKPADVEALGAQKLRLRRNRG